jgi:hypothetical protein
MNRTPRFACSPRLHFAFVPPLAAFLVLAALHLLRALG